MILARRGPRADSTAAMRWRGLARRLRATGLAGLLAVPLAAGGCFRDREAPEPGPAGPALPTETTSHAPGAHARNDMHAALRSDADNVRHPADGGGRAWLAASEPAAAGRPGRWEIVYEAGPLGIAPGGSLMLQVSPFWRWSTPQTEAPAAPGYTTIESDAPGITLQGRTLDQQLLGIEIGGRALAAGERIRIHYGAGEAGARADRFAERESRFWIAVDGDGDGVREFLLDSPTTDVAAGPPARLVLHLPATARPGETVPLRVAVLDSEGSAGVDFRGEIRFGERADSVTLAGSVALDASQRGTVEVPLRVDAEGIVRIEATAPGGLSALSNPMRVSAEAPRILFGDLHGHSNLSDGTGTPEDYYDYARQIAALDFVALTDHDHWGIPFLDQHPALRARIRAATEAAHAPGRFVALHGYEWTSWIHGHRHVVHFGSEAPLHSSLDEASDTPEELWALLRGQPAMTFAHHSAGGPVATDWTVAPDPELEPLTEIVSVHGSSEAADSPAPIYSPVGGNWVRDALALGYRLGFVGSGDSHDGHPGLAHLASGWGGLAAVFSEERTRAGLQEALRDRRTYATNGPRILLDVRLAGRMMGRIVAADALDDEAQLVVDAIGTGAIERVDVIRSGVVVASAAGEDRTDVLLGYPVRALRAGEYLYVRVVQRDGGAAWSSPFFVE